MYPYSFGMLKGRHPGEGGGYPGGRKSFFKKNVRTEFFGWRLLMIYNKDASHFNGVCYYTISASHHFTTDHV